MEMAAIDRESWLQTHCDDREVRDEVVRLLAEHDAADPAFLDPRNGDGESLLDRAARALAESSGEPAQPGELLADRYHIVREIGSGGSGVVYLAYDRALHDRPVVVKFLIASGEHDRLSQRFRHEIEALSRIRHPGVVGALDVGTTRNGRVFLVMEYVEGTTLRAELQEPLALDRVAFITGQIASALAAAHRAGVLHRDLKPENVMLQQSSSGPESVKLIDFGIAKVQYSTPGETRTVTFVGTINYVAPEQLMGTASAATDVYGLAIVVYEMLTGRRPFDPQTPFALYELQKGAIPAPSRFRSGISPAADRAILRALSFDPAERQTSPEEFAGELAAGLARKAGGFPLRAGAMLLVAALVIGIAVLLLRDAPSRAVGTIDTVAGVRGEQFGHIQAICGDPAGRIYFSDSSHCRIYLMEPGSTPRIVRLAGTGQSGFSGDGGDPLQARLNNPLQLAVASNGDVYFVDQRNQRIRKLSVQYRVIDTVAGTGIQGFGGDGGDPKLARFSNPFGLAMDSSGDIVIADSGNNRLRKVHFGTHATIQTIAGTGKDAFSGDGGDPLKAELSSPSGISFDARGNLYFCDQHNNRIRMITFGAQQLIRTVAGTGAGAYTGDGGDPRAAGLSGPAGLSFDQAGNLYIADSENHAIRMLSFGPHPVIRTVAGSGMAGSSGDGGPATSARLSLPNGVAIGSDGNLYIGDGLNDRIRRVNLSGK